MAPEDGFSKYRSLGMLSSIGIMFVLSTFIGLGIGLFLDKHLGTSPWMTIIFLIIGIISAFVSLYREIKVLVREDEASTRDIIWNKWDDEEKKDDEEEQFGED